MEMQVSFHSFQIHKINKTAQKQIGSFKTGGWREGREKTESKGKDKIQVEVPLKSPL